MPHRLMRYLGAIAIISLLPGGFPSPQGQEEQSASDHGIVATSRTLTIYKAECPPAYVGNASADECDANPVAGVPFRIGRPFTSAFHENVPTDAEGLVSFEFDGLPLDGTLRVIEELPADTDRFVVYCVDEIGDALGITYVDYAESTPNIGVVDIMVGEAGDVACDWYNVPSTPRADKSQAAVVGLVDEPRWWIVPFAPGYGNIEDGDLYFGVLVTNPTDATVHVGVSFRAYEADGTPFYGCQMPGGEGPGVWTTIAPGETALLSCTRTIAPRTLEGLQVTARLWDVEPLQSPLAGFEVAESDFAPVQDQSSPMETVYEASALIHATTNRDTDVALLFRFYDEQGVQVGTCESNPTTVEPEVEQRVGCSFPFILDTVSPQPVSVRVEPLPIRE